LRADSGFPRTSKAVSLRTVIGYVRHMSKGRCNTMNKYELGVIIKPGLEDDAFQAEMERVQTLVTRFEGTIEKVDEWGRRRLAYPIEKHTDGVYTFITFAAKSGAPAEIEGRLRIMENVLRFLIIRLDT
jgi:small subunit ribosomal protein S6